MPDINTFATGATIPTGPVGRAGDIVVDASALNAISMSKVYTQGRAVGPGECVVVTGLTSCVGLLLLCSGQYLVACHFNGGHNKSTEWAKIRAQVDGRQVLTAVMIVNDDGLAMDWDHLQRGVNWLGARTSLRYTPSDQNVPIALFRDGNFGEMTRQQVAARRRRQRCVIL
ncbi:MAG: hypothetical protein ACRBN8_44375 [Nannocystales bacterium]